MDNICFNFLPSNFEIKIIDEIEELYKIEKTWNDLYPYQLTPNPNAEFNHYLKVISNLENSRPFVIILRADKEDLAVVVGRLEKMKLVTKFGYKNVFSPKVNSLTIIYGGIFIRNSEKYTSTVIQILGGILKAGISDIIYFNKIKTDLAFYSVLKSQFGKIFRDHFPDQQKHWILKIPGSIDEYLSTFSKKHRYNLKRSKSTLYQDFDNVKIKSCSNIEQIDEFIDDAFNISKNTYQFGVGGGLWKDQLTRSRIEIAAKLNWFRGYILYINDLPVAYDYGFVYYKIFYNEAKGFDTDYKKYSVGTVLFLKIIEDFIETNSVDVWNFGLGDANYKQMYGTDYWLEETVIIYSLKIKTIFIFFFRTIIQAIQYITVNIISRLKLINKIKKAWRTVISK